ncbi:ribonuclease 3 [Clostridia bacterium]|nr:ribonuclease 3 [Clostridia bacterium]
MELERRQDAAWADDAMLSELEEGMGYTFRDISHLRIALTHSSVFPTIIGPKPGDTQDNQRLEFLGDAVVELCVSEALYHRYPLMREGDLTRTRITFVRKETLSMAARRLNLGDYLMMGASEREHGLADQTSVLCDTFEAVTAAIYLDGGFDAARMFVSRALDDYHIHNEIADYNWKSRLQELMQASGLRTPKYAIVGMMGPSHAPWFTAVAQSAEGKILGRGNGHSRKAAEQEAARVASGLFKPASEKSPATAPTLADKVRQEDALATQEA